MMFRISLACVLMSYALLPTGMVRNSWGQTVEPADTQAPFNFEEASRNVPKPREIYSYVKRDMVPMDLKIISDEIVPSDTDPSKQLRKITAHFNSLELEGRLWGHPCVILMPADNTISELTHQYRDGRNFYRAKIESDAKVQFVRTWYVYAHNPEWRGLMWFEWIMNKRGDYYETSVPGAKADACMIEVADTAMGFPGYVTSLPMKLNDAPIKDREARKAGWLGPQPEG